MLRYRSLLCSVMLCSVLLCAVLRCLVLRHLRLPCRVFPRDQDADDGTDQRQQADRDAGEHREGG